MPGATPIYAFPYPCADEPVTATDFTLLGNAIDSKLLEVSADADYAVGRYNISRDGGSQAGIVVAVETALTNPNAQYVVPVAGVYLTMIDVYIAAVTTITSSRLRVRLNGVAQYGRTMNWETGGFATGLLWQVPSGPVVAAAGDTISCAFLYQGTGTATVQIYISSRLVVRIA
jgi:hypothetical protein